MIAIVFLVFILLLIIALSIAGYYRASGDDIPIGYYLVIGICIMNICVIGIGELSGYLAERRIVKQYEYLSSYEISEMTEEDAQKVNQLKKEFNDKLYEYQKGHIDNPPFFYVPDEGMKLRPFVITGTQEN